MAATHPHGGPAAQHLGEGPALSQDSKERQIPHTERQRDWHIPSTCRHLRSGWVLGQWAQPRPGVCGSGPAPGAELRSACGGLRAGTGEGAVYPKGRLRG